MDVEQARLAISLVDLTDLTDDCTPEAVASLCDRAVRFGTAAVCVWPDFVAQAKHQVAGTGVRVATVVNFPSGAERPFAVELVTERALADGADEIDLVIPYHALIAGRDDRVVAMLDPIRAATAGSALMKVILETGELPDMAAVTHAANLAVAHGADFIKTSTGKSPVSATLEAAEAMLDVIDAADRPVGIKPSGGISTADDAERYIAAAELVMGEGWVSPATFRFGASGLLTALIEVAGLAQGQPPAPAATTAY